MDIFDILVRAVALVMVLMVLEYCAIIVADLTGMLWLIVLPVLAVCAMAYALTKEAK